MQISNMVSMRPVDTNVTVTQPGGGSAPEFAQFAAGDTVTGEVVSVSNDAVNVLLSNGSEVKMQFPDGVAARPGDQVDLTLVSKNQNTVQLKLEAINGQSVQLESSTMDAYLMDRGIPATRLNEAAAQVFIRNQIAPTPRNVSNLLDIAANLPDIPTSVALTMAENNIPPTKENAAILAKWANGPAALGTEVAALETQVSQDSGVSRFTTALQQNVQQQAATPQQAAVITQSPGFEQLAQQLSGMTGQDSQQAQQAIQSFTATLDLPPQEQQAVQTLLSNAFAATAEQFGEPIQQQPVQPQQAAADQAQAPQQQPVQQQGTPVSETGTGTQPVQQSTDQVQQQPQQVSTGERAVEQTPQQPQGQQQATGAAQDPGAHRRAIILDAQQATQNAGRTQSAQQESQPVRNEASWTGPRKLSMPATGTETENRPQTADASAAGRTPESAMRAEASQILSNLQKMIVKTRGRSDTVREDGQALEQGVRNQRTLANLTKAGISRLFGQESPAAQRANELSNQARLGSQMDQFFYAQIPYQTAQQSGTADLYVFQRHPQKADSEKTHITVLIGLDTQHMGRVESVLRSADDHLSVEFRVSSKSVQTFLEDSARTFSLEMKENGFPLESVRVTQIREKVTPLNAMKVMEPKKEIRLRGLDIEA